ncbi:hypothetical protein ACFSTD_07590 [Novosphingobium colocasiae]
MIAGERQVKTVPMDRAGNSDFAEAIAGALDWWREAGVDAHFVDDPIAWLAPPPSLQKTKEGPDATAGRHRHRPAMRPARPNPQPPPQLHHR